MVGELGVVVVVELGAVAGVVGMVEFAVLGAVAGVVGTDVDVAVAVSVAEELVDVVADPVGLVLVDELF